MEKAKHLCSPEEYAATRTNAVLAMTDVLIEHLEDSGNYVEDEIEEARTSLSEILYKWWDERNE